MTQQADGAPKWARWLWEPSGSTSEARGSGLTIDKIVNAGIEIADAEGLAGVSVRKLAQHLGSSTMAAYRHIDSRDDVVSAMIDVALGEPARKDAAGWEAGVRAWASAIGERYFAHPWLLDSPAGGMPTTPNRLRWMEAIVQVLAGAELDLQGQLDAALLIDGHVRTIAALSRSIEAAERESTVGEAPEWLKNYLDAEGLTAMSRVFEGGALDDGRGQELGRGVEWIIAGIRATSAANPSE